MAKSEPLFVAFTSRTSGRTAVIAEELGSVWLYLSHPHQRTPEVDCWLLNTEAPDRGGEFYREQNSPPPAPVNRVSTGGIRTVPSADRWTVMWSDDGQSVAALIDEQPVGFIAAGRKRGNARYINQGAESWALPWTEDEFRALFSP